jgi:hypothetical protein
MSQFSLSSNCYHYNYNNKKIQHRAYTLLLLLFGYFIVGANCVSFLPANINENITLKLEHSPFITNQNVIIAKQAKLTIEPGCELRFAKGKQLIVHGILDAKGTDANRIKFTKLTEQDYDYIYRFNNSGSGSAREDGAEANNNFLSSFKSNDQSIFTSKNNVRLVEGDTILDGKLQFFYNSKWHYVCSTQFK